MTKLEKITIYLISGILSCIAVFCLNHMDLEYISTWGVSLLEHVHHGNIENYAIDLFNIKYGTNYNLFQNMNVALWCLPLYIISNCLNVTIPMVIYQTCIKVVVAILHILCSRELYKIVVNFGFDDRRAFITSVLYYGSPFVMIHGIGIGQIDCIGILFFLISIRLLQENKYWPMAIAIGIALLSKFFVIIFYVPLFLLNFDKVREIIKYVCVAIIIPIIDKVVTTILINDYSLQADVHNSESFYPRLFEESYNYESLILVFVLIVCGVCLLLGNRGYRKKYYYLLFPSVIYFVFLLLVFWHPQWCLYILPALLIMGCYIANEFEYAFFFSGLTLGFSLHSLVNCNTNWINAILPSTSLFGKYVLREQTYIGEWILMNISEYAGNIGYTVFMAAFALLIILYYVNVYKEPKKEQDVKVANVIWYVIAILPVTFYIAVVLVKYVGV